MRFFFRVCSPAHCRDAYAATWRVRSANSALTQADGDIIAFPDDDCFYEPDTLTQVVEFFFRNQQYGAVLAHWSDVGVSRDESIDRVTTVLPVTRTRAFHRGETYVQFYRRQVCTGRGSL